MSDDEEGRGPGGQEASSASEGQGRGAKNPVGPAELPKRTVGGPGPAQKRQPSRQPSGEEPQERSALDATAPFGRRFQALGRRIDGPGVPETSGTRPTDAGRPGTEAAGGPEIDPTPDFSLFDEPALRTPRQPAKEPQAIRVELVASSPLRPSRRRLVTIVAGAVGAVLVLGGVLFAVLPKGDDDRSGRPFVGLGTAPGADTFSEQPETVAGGKSPRPTAVPSRESQTSAGPGGSSAAKTPGAPDSKAASPPQDMPSSPPGSGAEQGGPPVRKPVVDPPEKPSGGVSLSNVSGRCVSIANGSAAVSGERLEIRDCADVPWQKWQARSDGTMRAEGKCMDLNGNVTDNGVTVGWVDCNGSSAQLWALNSSHNVVNSHANKCLDVEGAGTANGTKLQISDCSGSGAQRWTVG